MSVGTLAIRAANEYRKRDLLAYLSLRHLFLASSSRLDRWATEVASDITATRTVRPYRHCRVYRGVSDRGLIEYRDLHFPAPTEMLAEAALLQACSQAGGAFERCPAVFSYVLVGNDSRIGMVAPYFIWWKKRQRGIRTAAEAMPGGTVVYFDIKQFYPSISATQARAAWDQATAQSQLTSTWRDLGTKLLADYSGTAVSSGLLMGPMFSHLMGNQVLRAFDMRMMEYAPNSYFRYVDDIALVLPRGGLATASESVRSFLPTGLYLNDDKSLEMSTAEWVEQSDAFESAVGSKHWTRFIGALKYFLVAHPRQVQTLSTLLRENGFRIPLRDYSNVVRQPGYLERLILRLRERWFDKVLRPSTPRELTTLAQAARREFTRRFEALVVQPLAGKSMLRKFQLQRLRYTASRLLFLATPDQLPAIESQISRITELSDVAAIFRALHKSDVTALLPYSGSVAQAAAQLILAQGNAVSCDIEAWGPELDFAWAVLAVSGVTFQKEASRPALDSPIVNFADGRRGAQLSDPYYREAFALSLQSRETSADLISEPLDRDEDPTFDALDLLHISS